MASFKPLIAAIAFYTRLPLPAAWTLCFQRVACLAPIVGLLIGGLLFISDRILAELGMPILTRSAIVVIGWLGITGGLHLDGAIDTADGLAVLDSKRRLEVMSESTTGAFGVMAGVAILLLKTAALADLPFDRAWILPIVAGWGRWGQQVAIARYPYLKPTGKGAFHKAAITSLWDTLPCLLLLLGLSAAPLSFAAWPLSLALASGAVIAWSTAAWFNQRLGGHTGDTYGAVVEWTEALLLISLTLV